MSWYSKKSHLLTQKSYLQQQGTQSIATIQTQIMMNIESIQKFYNLNSQKKLINIILDKKESAKLFSGRQDIISTIYKGDNFFQSQKEQKRIKFFAQKYSYGALVDKFPKPKSGTNELLLRILQKKMEKGVISSHQTRKSIWLLASGAKFNMINNKNLYQDLLKYHDYPKYFERSIIQDLHRTVSKNTSFQIEEDTVKLKNVLIAFSRRNPYIGYCQGLNFIAFFLLTMQFTQQEAFFLLSTMLESIIPMDYYTNMIGVVCDQQIFINILKVTKPHIVDKFDELGLDPSILSIEWFVCLFTSSLPFYLVKIVWDRLLVEGTRAFIKTGLILLSYFEDSIMEASEFHEIIMILEKGSKNLQVTETEFNAEFEKYYIDKKGLKIARGLYREYHIKEKLEQKVIAKRGKVVHPKCNLKWPICVSKLERLKREREEIDVWIYRPQNPPKVIHDYLTNKSQNFQKKINITGTFIAGNVSGQKWSNLTESFRATNQTSFHSKQYGENDPKYLNDIHSNQSPRKEQTKKKQESKKLSQDEFEELLSSKNPAKKSSELIIGRMDHICQKQAIEMEKIKRAKKSDIKFLSLMFEGDEENQSMDGKKCETYKKIVKASQIFDEEDHNNVTNNEQAKSIEADSTDKMQALEREERALLARSRTINFYNEFMEKNKELSSIISGVQNTRNQIEQIQKIEEESDKIDEELDEGQIFEQEDQISRGTNHEKEETEKNQEKKAIQEEHCTQDPNQHNSIESSLNDIERIEQKKSES